MCNKTDEIKLELLNAYVKFNIALSKADEKFRKRTMKKIEAYEEWLYCNSEMSYEERRKKERDFEMSDLGIVKNYIHYAVGGEITIELLSSLDCFDDGSSYGDAIVEEIANAYRDWQDALSKAYKFI